MFENNHLVANENIGPQFKLQWYTLALGSYTHGGSYAQGKSWPCGEAPARGQPGGQTAKPAQSGETHPKANPTFGKGVMDAMVRFGVVVLTVQHRQKSFSLQEAP